MFNFACAVVVPGSAFLGRLIHLTLGPLSQLLWQVNFFFHDTWSNSDKLNRFTDAAGALGFGDIFGNKWCYGRWPDGWSGMNIAILQFYPIVLS